MDSGVMLFGLVLLTGVFGPLLVVAVAVSGVPGDGSRVHTHDHDGSKAPDESPDSILSSEPKPLGKHMPSPPPSILPESKNDKVRVNTEESAVKPEPELKNTVGCNLNPSDGPGKPNSISMKTVKTKWALNQLQQPICVQLTKTVKTLKARS
ncbi:hypothetical protein Tco_1375585 [Tanacetum coccineum]